MSEARPKSTWAQIIQAICAVLLLAVAIFGYIYSVKPVATKARLEERNAELEVSVAFTERKIKELTKEAYSHVVAQYTQRVASAANSWTAYSIVLNLQAVASGKYMFGSSRESAPWDVFLESGRANVPEDIVRERSLTGRDLLLLNLNIPELRLLISEDADIFRKTVIGFIDSKAQSEVLLQRLMHQPVYKLDPDAEVGFKYLSSPEYREAANAERERVARAHRDFAVALRELHTQLGEKK